MHGPVIDAGGPPRLMVVVAHPDDETFACGSLLLHAAASGATTAVCCATRGEAGEPAPGSGVTREELPAVRERELRAAARLLRVSRVDVLDFVDSGMAGPAGPDTLAGAAFADVRDRVRECLEDFQPHVLVTVDATDGHRDHARIRDATLAAAQQARWRVARLYLHCLPQALMRRWLEHIAREHPTSQHLEADVPGTPEELITTVVDTGRHLAERERAIAAHASQVSPYDGLPADLRLAFLTAERLRRVVPAWNGGDRERDILAQVTSADAVDETA
ncbi:mycothiol S-conjugate amidase [Micromonospora viridifaciens]|uniref:Mycothiol S-conjugate amidase n=1 Tax=Micromonospora viridifaciens TaxID=1881 RepID=A0A1C4XKP3_MICVI|nr:PIG-L family deacetylase [Micromonospora viridifaciens]SCF09004.1 mycothiol S-conjugate amidase [Micromonospora viridifaciens]